jgi:hypothetical protein
MFDKYSHGQRLVYNTSAKYFKYLRDSRCLLDAGTLRQFLSYLFGEVLFQINKLREENKKLWGMIEEYESRIRLLEVANDPQRK